MDLKTDMKIALARKALDQEDIASELGITQQAVSDWGNKGKIPRKHWDYVRTRLGLDPSSYNGVQSIEGMPHDTNREPATLQQTTTGHNAMASTGGKASITINGQPERHIFQQPPSGRQVTLSELEYETLVLFRQYGNPHLLEKCRATLLKAKDLFE